MLHCLRLPALPLLLAVACTAGASGRPPEPAHPVTAPAGEEHVPAYRPRFGRQRPVIAVVGLTGGTELTDYVVPYGILHRAAVGEVVALGTDAGAITMRPALRLRPQASLATFDARYPQGADYVVVPAVAHRDDPVLLGWIRSQAAKGATLVSICDGALVLAAAGVLDGHRATAHWATADYRRKAYPNVRWVDDRRYVADGTRISSAGISAAIPTALALVEAIAGHDRAAAVAAAVGTPDWSALHDSRRFHPAFGRNLSAFATTQYLNGWLHRPQAIGIAARPGMDEIALALTADAYSRTGRAKAGLIGSGPIETLGGLTLLPDRADPRSVARVVPVAAETPARALDRALAGIAATFGQQTAYGVALDFEYPGFHG